MKIDHVALYVKDLELAKNFFVKYFGALSNDGYHNKKTNFRSYFLSFGVGTRLEIMTRPGLLESENSPLKTGFIHLSFSVGSKEKVDELTARLRSDGYDVLDGPRTTGDGYYESCVKGVENNLIEITV